MLSKPYLSTTRHAFTLVELSIVLVIVSLITGGVLAGRSLVRAAELRSVITDYQRYLAATVAFKGKYFALPGDMTNATQFWGRADIVGACAYTASTDTKTCDGDGNTWIDSSADSDEMTRFWQHLANAGLVAGQYDGVYDVINDGPPSKVGDFWWTNYVGPIVGSSYGFDGDYGNTLSLTAVMTPDEIWNIDSKMDDGKPGTGKIVVVGTGPPSFFSTCTDAAGALNIQTATLTASYLLTSTTKCGIWFRNIF